ncbi:hypothetical protein HanOQP8_Chr02g0040061 [Helianthus annuus]|nr:hypothetical protein HanOQP8_Chr02g0040061 [Helianthus annuus]
MNQASNFRFEQQKGRNQTLAVVFSLRGVGCLMVVVVGCGYCTGKGSGLWVLLGVERPDWSGGARFGLARDLLGFNFELVFGSGFDSGSTESTQRVDLSMLVNSGSVSGYGQNLSTGQSQSTVNTRVNSGQTGQTWSTPIKHRFGSVSRCKRTMLLGFYFGSVRDRSNVVKQSTQFGFGSIAGQRRSTTVNERPGKVVSVAS